jgi:hypothetical protein
MVAMAVMALVITGSLVAMGQVTLLSEKSRDQAFADFYLRAETEQLRSLNWTEVKTLSSKVLAYESTHNGNYYPELQTLSPSQMTASGMSAQTKSQALNSLGETGKIIFHMTMFWADKTGKSHEESRVLIITEGGFSANK